MSTSREKMQQARELIQAKRYNEARMLLRTVNHDMALEWLDKIDKLDPPAIEAPPAEAIVKPQIKQLPSAAPRQKRNWTPIIVLVAFILIAMIIYFAVGIKQANDYASTEVSRIENVAAYCKSYCTAIDGGPQCIDDCFKGTPTPGK